MMSKLTFSIFTRNKTFIIFFLIYNLFIFTWNYSYLPITEGWFLLAGKLISEGKTPYIDFYAYLTPFYYWFSYFLYQASENLILFSRIVGHFIFCLIFYFTYIFFRINFSSVVSTVATFFSLLIYLSSAAIITYDFTHLITLFSLISIVLIINSNIKYSHFLAGVFSTLIFLTKQSNGFVIYTFLAIIYIYKNRSNLKLLIYPIVGSLITFLLVLFPILSEGGFNEFFNQITIHAGNSKGGIVSSLTNLFPPKSDYYSIKNIFNFLFDSFFPLLIVFLAYYRFNNNSSIFVKNFRIYNFFFIAISVYFLILIFTSLKFNLDSDFINNINTFFWNKAFLWSGYYVFFLIPIARYTNFNNYSLFFLFGLIIASATSAGLTAVSIFLHLGFMIGILFHFRSIFNISMLIGLVFLVAVPTHSILKKYETGYYWWGVNAKLGSVVSNEIEKIKYIRNDGFSEELVKINNIIESCQYQPENLLSFPHTTMINLATDLNPPGKAITYWFDFLSNEHAEMEYELLKKISIDSFVMIEMEQIAWDVHNRLFRKGKGLKQKKVKDYLIDLTKSGNFDEVYSQEINSRKVSLFIKKNLNCVTKY